MKNMRHGSLQMALKYLVSNFVNFALSITEIIQCNFFFENYNF